MAIQSLLLAVAIALSASCSEPNASRHRGDVSETPVARVLKLNGAGSATAQREKAEPRPIDSGSQLYADDALTTSGDVVVEIRVFKNKSQLLLSHANARKLSETAAWTTSKDSESKKLMFIDRNNKDETPAKAAPPSPPAATPTAPGAAPPPPGATPPPPAHGGQEPT